MKSYSLTYVRYESIIVKRSIWVFYDLQKHTIIAGYLDSATLFYHFIIFLNAALPFARHLFMVPKYYTLFCLWNNFSRILQSFSFHDVKGFKTTCLGLEHGALLIVSSAVGVALALQRVSNRNWSRCHSAARTKVSAPSAILPPPDSVLISSEGGEFSTEAGLNLPALVRVAPIDYRLGQRPQQS